MRTKLAIVIAVIVAFYLGIITVALQPVPKHEPGSPPPSQQVKLESSIVNDRKHLFNGVLIYQPLNPIAVGDPREFHARLIAIGQNPGEVFVPRGNVTGSRSLRVGGVEGATLSVGRGGVQISPVGPTHGLIGQPGDRVDWTWNITPSEPGDYTLQLVVVTYQGMSDNPLSVVHPPVEITLNVTDTWSHRLSSLKGWIIGLSAFLAALGVILAFFREQVLGLLPKRKRQEKE